MLQGTDRLLPAREPRQRRRRIRLREHGSLQLSDIFPTGWHGVELAKQGKLAFDYGAFFFKGQSMFLVSHSMNLDQAAEGYEHFDKREDGWTKVVLHP
ncbi:hypothetical protein SAMN04489732_12019 [Amycolatopsis saalfeldensis]|uniref:Uncharacterized protein n=1 Tax=Amycolatopsis saalfeldensis TaxID=394193 RepID=A0A1H8YJM6_9PSEU|nr:hypothetical protein SAMN04489732_12019 [Amycolatopsis saalfeldensis]